MNALSLHDYRLSCPATAPIPTITQSGLIGPILILQQQRALRKMRNRARLQHWLSLPVHLFIRLWRGCNALLQRAAKSPISPAPFRS